ncbi:MAG: DUF3291 domain-containing protein [Actinobacteria bacterium]|nr:DUF3291 domain-containing protein [Actinomycetota bacterium]
MKSPWKSVKVLEPHRQYLVLASSIPPRSMSSTFRLFRGASAVRKQLEVTEGIVGFSLLARPLRKQYATLSVWIDEAALAAFATASPHGELMADLSPEMGTTKFVRWVIKGVDGRPSWEEALKRLGGRGRRAETPPDGQ